MAKLCLKNKFSFSSYMKEVYKIPIIVNSKKKLVEEVPDFKYFGSSLTPNGQEKDEIAIRMTFFLLEKTL